MAFSTGGAKGQVKPSMNVTPLVDVVLVLLIIFMVITPMLSRQFWLHLPQKNDGAEQAPPPEARPPVVLTVRKDGALLINQEVVSAAELSQKLQRIFAARGENVLFFAAEDDTPYGAAMRAMDQARAGGALTIAVLTEAPQG